MQNHKAKSKQDTSRADHSEEPSPSPLAIGEQSLGPQDFRIKRQWPPFFQKLKQFLEKKVPITKVS